MGGGRARPLRRLTTAGSRRLRVRKILAPRRRSPRGSMAHGIRFHSPDCNPDCNKEGNKRRARVRRIHSGRNRKRRKARHNPCRGNRA
jgi:hypothetical protein